MAYRSRQQIDILWLTEPMTLVTEWKRGFNGQPVPKKLITGQAGMALVVITSPTGRQHKAFHTAEEVTAHFEEEEAPEHVQAETTHAWYPFTLGEHPPLSARQVTVGRLRDFFIEPPEAPKAL